MKKRSEKFSLRYLKKIIVKPLVRSLHPEKIIVFGSHAYGNPRPNSDVDLLIVLKRPRDHIKRYKAVSRIFSPRPFPMDILVRTPREITERLRIGDFFFEEIVHNGVVLYDKQAA